MEKPRSNTTQRTFIHHTHAHDLSKTRFLILQNKWGRYASLSLPRATQKPIKKVGEVSQITLVRFKYKRETKSELKEMKACLLFWKSCKKTPSTEKRKWIMLSIKLFWGSIFKDEGVSHPESKVWGKLRNNSYTFFEFMNSGLCLIRWIYSDSFCSGRAKSRCGGVLAVDFYDFYRQHFSRNSWLEG